MGSRVRVGAKKGRNSSSIYITFPHQIIARISVLAVCAALFVHKIRHLTFVQLYQVH